MAYIVDVHINNSNPATTDAEFEEFVRDQDFEPLDFSPGSVTFRVGSHGDEICLWSDADKNGWSWESTIIVDTE